MASPTLALLLVTAARQTFGIPAEQIEQLSTLPTDSALSPKLDHQPEAGPPALSAGLGHLAGPSSTLLWTKAGAAWAVEAVQGLTALPLRALRRVPRVLARHTTRAIWGVVVYEGNPIWLLDLSQLSRSVAAPQHRSQICDE
ncbi:MAG TPA: hypothetical protein VJG32_12410 [Anaerolineae bacterium]|nr:hypothetical protein [Anaerolineae bacterium]